MTSAESMTNVWNISNPLKSDEKKQSGCNSRKHVYLWENSKFKISNNKDKKKNLLYFLIPKFWFGIFQFWYLNSIKGQIPSSEIFHAKDKRNLTLNDESLSHEHSKKKKKNGLPKMIENDDKLFIIYKVTLHQWLWIKQGR